MRRTWFFINTFVWLVICAQSKAFAISRARGAGEVARKDAVSGEPTCEELKVMWRFSKRQSRAAEVTNEIPTYRDPFSYNVWEPYLLPRSRSIGGMPLGRPKARPIVYGTIIHKPPMADRHKFIEELARSFGTIPHTTEPRRKVNMAFRLGGGRVPSMRYTPQSGSFQHLKELIRTERARELQEQRMAEEAAARAAALKELGGHGNYRNQASYADYEQEEAEPAVHEGVVAFPDILAPAARIPQEEYQQQDYYSKDIPYYKSHRSSYYDMNSLNNGMDDLSL